MDQGDYEFFGILSIRNIMGLAVSPNDLQLALIENHVSPDDAYPASESCVRFYEVGRSKADDLAAEAVEVWMHLFKFRMSKYVTDISFFLDRMRTTFSLKTRKK